MSPSARRVVISGLGFATSIGNDRTSVTHSLKTLKGGIERFEFIPGARVPVTVAGTLKEFEFKGTHYSEWRWPSCYSIPRDLLRSLPPHGVCAVCSIEQLAAEAKLTPNLISDESTGLFTASAGSPRLQHAYLKIMDDSAGLRMSPMGVVASISGTLNFNLGTFYHVRGAICGFSSACASTAHAIGYASDEIRSGRLDRVIVVGGEDLSAESTYSFNSLNALSRNPDPSTASRPFDRGRDGFVGTGGAAALLVEEAQSALERGAPIYAELAGWGQSADGHHLVASDPTGHGLARAMRQAMRSGGMAADEVDYVNAHATSTPAGDLSEIRALHEVFTSTGASPSVSSTKALTGHSLSMASVMETAFCAIAMRDGFIPGQANLQDPDPECGSLRIPRQTEERAPRIVLKNSSGFGGSNVVLALRQWSGA